MSPRCSHRPRTLGHLRAAARHQLSTPSAALRHRHRGASSFKLQAPPIKRQASGVEHRRVTATRRGRFLHCGRSCPKNWGPFGRLRGPLGGGQFAASSPPLAATHRRPQSVCVAEGTHASFGWTAFGSLAVDAPPSSFAANLGRPSFGAAAQLGRLECCVCKERPAKSASLPVCQLSK